VAITTHVLDLSRGMPAAGVPVTLEQGTAGGGAWDVIGRGETDADGRLRTLMPGDAPPVAGLYRLVFDTRTYLERHAGRAFFPTVSVVFEIKPGESHHHVPLLLSPFGYSTYRGS
jgi:5-hydroxyisourate hydrolase